IDLGHDHPLIEVLADFRRQGGVERLSLKGLDSSGVAEFMERAAGQALTDEDLLLARAIHEETDGNPFFMIEVLRHLRETGALEEAIGARLVMETTGGRYRFAHALVRDTVYDGLSPLRRVALHRRVAEAIEAIHANRLDDYLPALAHHWGRASAPAAHAGRAA